MPMNVQTTTLLSHASKLMLKLFQARLRQYVNRELRCTTWGRRRVGHDLMTEKQPSTRRVLISNFLHVGLMRSN